jgi:zinc D-Ala-D-Ala carboxypeptidase
VQFYQLLEISKVYKFFKEEEVKGLQIRLVQMLDRAREYSGIPFYLTSTLRTEETNKACGGVSDSSHLKGLAVDIRANTSEQKFKIMTALIAIGFKRIGIYPNHIHCDIDKLKPQDVLWLG